MYLIDNRDNTNPAVNLAIEEHIIRNISFDEDALLFYTDKPSVVVGKNQNVFQEVDLKYLQKNNIGLYRRISGGGTVYHDPGNLNFTFFSKYAMWKFNNYEYFNTPIINALRKLDLNAYLGDRNNILVDGLKVSGNAQFTSRNRMLSHGTLLIKADLKNLSNALNTKLDIVESKATKSKKSKVVNVSDILSNREISLRTIQNLILDEISRKQKIPKLELTDLEWEKVHRLADSKYKRWEWNIGESPKIKIRRHGILNGKKLSIILEIGKGKIQTIELEDDTREKSIKNLLNEFTGVLYKPECIQAKLDELEIRTDELLNLLY